MSIASTALLRDRDLPLCQVKLCLKFIWFLTQMLVEVGSDSTRMERAIAAIWLPNSESNSALIKRSCSRHVDGFLGTAVRIGFH